MTFVLNERLEADTVEVLKLDLCTVRLMQDQRFGWLILVPRRAGLVELTDLRPADRHLLMDEVACCSALLQSVFSDTHKMNIGALGNMVRQLHVHVIARRTSDAAWPNPVWGVGAAEPYRQDVLETMLARLRGAFNDSASKLKLD